MLNLKKEAEALKVHEIELANCPICSSVVLHQYFMQDSKTKKQSRWYSCSCGVVFQDKKPNSLYDKAYWDKFDAYDKKLKDAYEYPVRIYAPLIEELIYGRKILIIGRTTNHQEEAFTTRGWVSYVIDKNNSFEPSERLFVGDFEDYDFGELKFDMIWMYQTLECFLDPVKALAKCKALLGEDGIIFIGTPDTDFIHTRSSISFIHWKPEMHYLMWNQRSISKHLESLGFNQILLRQNCWPRFPATDDLHGIWQKKFF